MDPAWPIDGRAICADIDWQSAPTMTEDGTGGAIITWYDFRNDPNSGDIYAQRVSSSGAVDPSWPVNGRAICTADDDQGDPIVVSDGGGGAIIAWPDYRGGTSYDIYAQHLLPTGVLDPAWPADGLAVCTADYDQEFPAIVSDGAGGAIVVWEDNRNGANADLYARHVLSTGVLDPAGASDGDPLCTAPDDQWYPTIVADGTGGAIATWQDLRDDDVYAQRLASTGIVDPAWPLGGSILCSADGLQFQSPKIASDGVGGAILTWPDFRSVLPGIYVHRVYANGGVAAVPHGATPGSSMLLSPCPNPVHGAPLIIRFDLPSTRIVSVEIVDVAGHRVRSLARNREFSPGLQTLVWDGCDHGGARLASGVYFVRLWTDTHSEMRRTVLLQ